MIKSIRKRDGRLVDFEVDKMAERFIKPLVHVLIK